MNSDERNSKGELDALEAKVDALEARVEELFADLRALICNVALRPRAAANTRLAIQLAKKYSVDYRERKKR